MRFPTWKNRSADWVGKNKKSIFIALGLTAACIIMSPWLFPGGIGLRGGSLVTEKTVRQLSDGEIEETTTTTTTSDSGKTVWDWFSLLGVPVSLVLLGAWIQRTQQQQTAAETQEESLQKYFDYISVFLVDKSLIGIAAKEDSSIEQKELLSAAVDMIRARTLSILRRFQGSGERKASVIRFLIETEVVAKLALDLKEADLSGAKLNGAKLGKAKLGGAKLVGAELNQSTLTEAYMCGADLRNAELCLANLSGVTMIGADLRRADMRHTDLRNAHMGNADMRRTNLRNACLRGSKPVGADMRRADMRNTDLSRANLGDADMRRANLRNANLSKAKLHGADLSDANLNDANLSYTDLSGADLRRADLRRAKGLTKEQLKTAKLCRTKLPKGIDIEPNRDC